MPTPPVSVVIVTFNSEDDLEECIPSVAAQDYPDFQIVAVDNNSADDTAVLLERQYPFVKVIRNGQNYGCAKGYNIGIGASTGKYVILLNPDTVVDKNWLSELVRVMECDDNIAACQSRVLLYGSPNTINTEGNEVNYLGFTWCRNYGKPSDSNAPIEETVGLSVCSAILRRDALEKVGLFDEDYFMYLDDTDIGLRMYLLGYKVVCNPNSVVYHKYRFQPTALKLYYLEKNRLLLLLKLYSKGKLLKILPIFAFVEAGLLVLSVFQGWFWAKVQSYIWIARRWRAVLSKRRCVRRDDRRLDKILRMMSPEVTFEDIQNPVLNRFLNPLLRAYYGLIVRPQDSSRGQRNG